MKPHRHPPAPAPTSTSTSTMSEDVEVYTFHPENKPNGWQEKHGQIAWNGDTLFIPASATGMNDTEALLCVAHDDAQVVISDGHVLVSEEWARRERPKMVAVYDAIRKQAVKARQESDSQTPR